MKNQPSPTLQNDRADILDVIRGFAILGIFMDNLFAFTGWGFFSQTQREAVSTWPADGVLGLLELIFVHGKFYSIFSLLFGIGFSIILIRNEQKGINPLKIFFRRLFILLLIGSIHLFLLWDGDILFLYALLGFLLPLFRNCSDKTLLTWAAILIVSPLLIDSVKVIFHFKTGAFLEKIAQGIDKKTGVPIDETFSKYLFSEGSGWQEWRNWLSSGWAYRYAYLLESNRAMKVLGIFLIGFYVGRKMIYANLQENNSLFKKLLKWGLIIGIPSNIIVAYFEINNPGIQKPLGLVNTFFTIGVIPLSLAYVSGICLLWLRSDGASKWKILAPVGRMAMTNYLMQTILGIVIFYGVGFGLGGNIGPALFLPIGLTIYSFQVIYSNWWFRYFNYGPLEWVWRQLTYGKRLSILKTKA
jgi:uncharacterized protein